MGHTLGEDGAPVINATRRKRRWGLTSTEHSISSKKESKEQVVPYAFLKAENIKFQCWVRNQDKTTNKIVIDSM